MSDLFKTDFRDPLQVLMAREASTCKGCAHIDVTLGRQFCTKGRDMKRKCKSYVERIIHVSPPR